MKTASLTLLCVASAMTVLHAQVAGPPTNPPAPAATPFRVIERGPNHRILQREDYALGSDGQVVTNQHSYTELKTGMHHLENGQYVESQELIEPCATGAIAQHGQTRVLFANNLNTWGAIDLTAQDGKRLRSNILGLGYLDRASGQGVIFAQLKDSQGQLISANEVLYPDAFDGVSADVAYSYKLGAFEQNVVLRSQIAAPEAFGLSSASSEIEVFTEFITSETAAVTTGSVDGNVDQTVTWGQTQIGKGRAFMMDESADAAGVPVGKVYLNVSGRKILVECVPLKSVAASLDQLPLQASVTVKRPVLLASQEKMIPPARQPAAQPRPQPMKLALATPAHKGLVLDYNALNLSLNNFTFQGGVTYLVSGVVNLAGATTISGGAVIKYSTFGSCSLNVLGTVNCQTAPYLPAVLTSVSDATVGENIPVATSGPLWNGPMSLQVSNAVGDLQLVCILCNNSWYYDFGSPAIKSASARNYAPPFISGSDDVVGYFEAYDANWNGVSGQFTPNSGNGLIRVDSGGNVIYTDLGGASVALALANGGALHDLRICNAGVGISSSSGYYSVNNVQFVNCGIALATLNGSFYAGNVLMSKVGTAFWGMNNFHGQVEQMTYDQGTHITDDLNATRSGSIPPGECVNITNAIITAVADNGPVPVNLGNRNVRKQTSNASVYQTAATGSYYLSANYHLPGSPNITPTLLAQLQTMTTYAPQTGDHPVPAIPELGYHYPMDSDNDGLPDWWELYWFGNYSHTGLEQDANGNTLAGDYDVYVNGGTIDPNVIAFSIESTNDYVNHVNASYQLNITAGGPSYYSVFVEGSSTTTNWLPFAGTNLIVPLGSTDGVYQVWFGLKGFASEATATWVGTTVYLDRHRFSKRNHRETLRQGRTP